MNHDEQKKSDLVQTSPVLPNPTPSALQDHPLLNIVFNIAAPIFILNKLSSRIGAVEALILALLFPFGYGAYDYFKKKKMNVISILGLINILTTGSLALMGVEDFLFACKEAAFPSLIGIFVFISAFTKKPFIETFILNPQVFNLSLILERIENLKMQNEMKSLSKKSTLLLSCSFFFSAILNFFLAIRIFQPIDMSLAKEAHQHAFNQQLGEMTKWSMLITLLPSMILLGGILFYFIKKLGHITGLKQEEILKQG